MAISKELKEYITNKRAEELGNIDVEIKELIEQNIKEALKSDVNLLEIEMLYTRAQESLQKLNEKHGAFFPYDVKMIIEGKFPMRNFVKPNVKNAGVEVLEMRKANVSKKYDALILKLSMEKDFDKINAILTEVGIGI